MKKNVVAIERWKQLRHIQLTRAIEAPTGTLIALITLIVLMP